MINWKNYVDRIFVIHKIDKERYDNLIKQLEYFDILSSGICDFIYDFPEDNKIPYHKLSHNKYLCFKYSKLFGYKRILIIEDDICVLKDKDRCLLILETMPDKFSICYLDYQVSTGLRKFIGNLRERFRINLEYFNCDELTLFSNAFMIVDKQCFDTLIDYYENNTFSKDSIFPPLGDRVIFRLIPYNKICPYENIAVQKEYSGKLSEDWDAKLSYIELSNLNLNNYYLYR